MLLFLGKYLKTEGASPIWAVLRAPPFLFSTAPRIVNGAYGLPRRLPIDDAYGENPSRSGLGLCLKPARGPCFDAILLSMPKKTSCPCGTSLSTGAKTAIS